MSLKLCYSNLIDATATIISSNSEVSSLPDDNVAHFWKTKVWRATGDAAEWIKFDFGSAQDVTAVIIVGHNFTSGATVTLELNAADNWVAPTVQQAIAYHADIMLYVFSSAQNYQWARITIADAANPDTYVEVGRIFLGTYLIPERTFTEYRKIRIDPSLIGKSRDGVKSIDSRTAYIQMSFAFRNTLIDDVETVVEDVGTKKSFFVIPDYDDECETDGKHDLSRYVSFIRSPSYNDPLTPDKRRHFQLDFEESL